MITIKPRPPQQECLDLINANPTGRYVIAAHVGYGKTFIMSRIKKLGRVLILSHREELVYQPLKYMSGTTGVEKGKEKSNHTEDVVSASVQTLSRRLDEYDPEEFYDIYYDECLSENVEVMTVEGFKSIRDITTDDIVCQYDPQTKRYSWVKPSRVVAKETTKVIHTTGGKLDFYQTENHRNLCSNGKVVLGKDVDGQALYKANTVVKGTPLTLDKPMTLYCLTVDTSFFVVRNNGVVFITGNCHHAAAPENRKILEYFKPKRVIGFSATPSRNDNIRLDDIFDKVLYEYDIKQGIDNGYLAPIKVLSVKMDYDLANVKMRMGDLAPTGLAEAMKDTAPSIAEAYYKYARGTTLIFCASVELAYKVAELIEGAEVIEGKTPPDKRKEILEKFSSGEIKVVCNNLVLTEGYDNPRIETVIMARPTTNTNLVVQCLDYETEILTKEGWKSYGNIATGDDVITYNIDKKVIEFDKALEVFDREVADGESFIKIKSQLMDIRITDNHNVLFKGAKNSGDYSLKQATELLNYSDGVRIPVAGEMNFKGVDLTDEEIRMMGWALSDAHIRKNKAITITQSLDVNKPNCEEIESLLIRNNVKFTKTIKTNTTNFTNGKLRNQAIFYISNGNSNRLKNVPQQYFQNPKFNGILEKELSDEFLYNATKHQWNVFIDTFEKADGHKRKTRIDTKGKPYKQRTISITKGNKALLERMQIGNIIRGMRSNIRQYGKNKYTLKTKETDNVVVGAKHDGRAIFEVDKPKENERVWCIKTNNSTLITRRDGIVSITGNCIGRGARLFEGKENCLVIDCVSATRDGLASPTSLLGYDMPLAALKRMKEEEVDLFDIPDLAEELADVPETWIKGVKEVDIWAKKHKVKLHDMNLRKRGDGSLVIGLPNNIFYEVPPIDVLGKIEIQGQKVKAQEVIDSLFTRLMTHHRPEMPIWSKRSSKRWGSKPLTQKQYDMIRHLKNVDLSGVEITKLTSMEASIIIGESKLRRKK